MATAAESVADQLSNRKIADNLQKNLKILSPDHLVKILVEMGQSHLFEEWPEPGVGYHEKTAFFDQDIHKESPPTSHGALETSQAHLAPYPTEEASTHGQEEMVPPQIEEIQSTKQELSAQREEMETKETVSDIVPEDQDEIMPHIASSHTSPTLIPTVALPSETCTGTCFLELYIESILALQEASCRLAEGAPQKEIPFAIMTSDDTHACTLALLESNAYFGMKPTQVTLLEQYDRPKCQSIQEKVACLADNDAKLAVDPQNKYKIQTFLAWLFVQTKPHGHGDVHSLLYSSGLLSKWHDTGVKWVLFFQDTNGLLFKAIPASLGVSATKQYQVNSLAVPRKAKEAIGGIARLTQADGTQIT
ncbi:hypothetical protein Cgig2_004791 [Carnegiea gigantea]|uniref:UTP-monosaccharide-1-phosphate uridylyltransferase n=1 Tax=Carnegiea gigantea TaxID=171969 RepID=A0A9Q1KV86_9CARY|nr:hypothetical protein Cgig2_004791 [Carnegiea gigantea]